MELITSLKITINNNYQLQCSVIESDGNEEIIHLKPRQKEWLPIVISFDMNEMYVCEKEREDSISFMKEWIEFPQEYKKYEIQYQGREYSVIAEVLFALIIKQFKERVENEWIIDETIVEVPSYDYVFIQRLRISLESIDMKEICINPSTYDYEEQGSLLETIIEKRNDYEKYKKLISRANKISTNSQKQKSIDIDNTKPFSHDEFRSLLIGIDRKERSDMKLTQLDNYCIFLSSKYFNTIDDHINLIRVCKRLKWNMAKYFFNPLPLTSKTRRFFPNLQTLFVYSPQDNLFEDDKRIIARKKLFIPYFITRARLHMTHEPFFN